MCGSLQRSTTPSEIWAGRTILDSVEFYWKKTARRYDMRINCPTVIILAYARQEVHFGVGFESHRQRYFCAPENTGAGSRACRGRMCQCPWEATLIDIAETQGGDPKTQHEVEHVWFSTEVDDSLRNLSRANDTGFCRVLLKENGSALRYAHKLPDCYNPCVRAPGGTFWCRLRIPPAALFLFFSGNASKWLCCLAVMMAYALLSYGVFFFVTHTAHRWMAIAHY